MIKTLYPCFQHWSEKGGVWIISDTHFSESDIIAGMHRPDDKTLIDAINSKVGKYDTLIHLGDVGNLECAKKLKGYKILIQGNHDNGAANYLGIFDEVYPGGLQIAEKLYLSHEPVDLKGVINLHGHIHNQCQFYRDDTHFNFALDCLYHYQPINLGNWIKEGWLNKIPSLHRQTIDYATEHSMRKEKQDYGN